MFEESLSEISENSKSELVDEDDTPNRSSADIVLGKRMHPQSSDDKVT